jgi:hypothetical protein
LAQLLPIFIEIWQGLWGFMAKIHIFLRFVGPLLHIFAFLASLYPFLMKIGAIFGDIWPKFAGDCESAVRANKQPLKVDESQFFLIFSAFFRDFFRRDGEGLRYL